MSAVVSAVTRRPVAADDQGLIAALAAAGLPTADLNEPNQRFFAFEGDSRAIIGYGGFARAGRAGLLRSLVVLPAWRRQGYGQFCLHALMAEVRKNGLDELYLLTTTAEAFFLRHGFMPMPRQKAPPEIASTREFRDCCPKSAVLLHRKATDRA
jgi:N-acetylglutamate synthase-like GNAT family acetyltransferase